MVLNVEGETDGVVGRVDDDHRGAFRFDHQLALAAADFALEGDLFFLFLFRRRRRRCRTVLLLNFTFGVPFIVLLVGTRVFFYFMILDKPYLIGHIIQEITIMGNGNHGSRVIVQKTF